ncbi:hypothetical protein [Streptomyces sp. NPDC005244]|uniref:hypothetical protein n=1 Tax=Streptomyces sp. NPDC005244 TaxID=3364708 RepID=UPI0036C26A07
MPLEDLFAHLRVDRACSGSLCPATIKELLLAQRMELFRAMLPSATTDSASVPDRLGRLWCDLAGTPFPHQAPALTAAFGSERVLYGGDCRWTPAFGVDAQIASLTGAAQPAGDTWHAPDHTKRPAALPAPEPRGRRVTPGPGRTMSGPAAEVVIIR